MLHKKYFFGLAALLLGLIALGLAIVPRALMSTPPPWPKAQQAEPQHVIEGGKSFEWKGVKVTVGGTSKVVEPPPPPPPPAVAKTFAVATAVVALIGIGVGVFACWRERTYALAIPGVTLCTVAVLWNFILLGVILGIAAIVLLLVLFALGGALPG